MREVVPNHNVRDGRYQWETKWKADHLEFDQGMVQRPVYRFICIVVNHVCWMDIDVIGFDRLTLVRRALRRD